MWLNEIRGVSARIMCVGICIKREFWSVINVHAPGIERSEEGKDGFWEELKTEEDGR